MDRPKISTDSNPLKEETKQRNSLIFWFLCAAFLLITIILFRTFAPFQRISKNVSIEIPKDQKDQKDAMKRITQLYLDLDKALESVNIPKSILKVYFQSSNKIERDIQSLTSAQKIADRLYIELVLFANNTDNPSLIFNNSNEFYSTFLKAEETLNKLESMKKAVNENEVFNNKVTLISLQILTLTGCYWIFCRD